MTVVRILFAASQGPAMAYLIHDRGRIGAMGAALERWSSQRMNWLHIFLARFVTVPSSHDLVLKWAQVMVVGRRAGRRLETADAWIAATAVLYEAPLLTHNWNDYLGVKGLDLISESL